MAATEKRDRKLGDEWADWDGRTALEFNEPPATFLLLSIGILVLFAGLIYLGWYLVEPRIYQINPVLPRAIEWSSIIIFLLSLSLLLAEIISIFKFGSSLLPYKFAEKVLLSLLPKAVWLGKKFGICRDRVGNSFIKINNIFTRAHSAKISPERLLILLPRCLKKEARARILEQADGKALKVLTVAGGEEAREAIKQNRPTIVLALACERDLMSGIKDIAERIPVIAIPNRRPDGPCKNTDFFQADFENALEFLSELKK